MSKNRIVYLWTWPQNFGNAFIDLGSIQSLKEAAPDYTINQVGGLSRVLFEDRHYGQKRKIFRWIPARAIKSTPLLGERVAEINKNRFINSMLNISEIEVNKIFKNFLDLSLHFNSDFAVLSGCILDWYLIRQFGATLLNLKNKNIKIIINGGGGSSYNEKVINKVRKFLEKIKPYGFISRDEVAFKNYQDLAEYSYNGIDCGFFVNDYFTPAKLEMPKYCVFTFDRQPEPEIEVKDRLIVRTHHSHYCDPPKSYFEKPNTLISNLPEDYLNLYANAEAVYSDRVHACVVALSYGTPCKLYHKTPRALLFDRVEARGIEKELTYPDTNRIEREKKKQIKFLSDVLEG
ncbi:hypothetical protein CW713_07800 [Methanophagales archaeon]|nr:MAG: hypothetical protein CW713_07800 [Methanophagales archaeon]